MISPARVAAFSALRSVSLLESDLPAALSAVRATLTDDRDRALTTDLVTGTLRWQNELDFAIAGLAKRPLARLDLDILLILRLGAYQLRHLDRVPPAAVVNDAVALTKRARKTSAAGFVNALLRGLSRAEGGLPLPLRDAMPLDYLEVTLSHPRWLANRWHSRYGLAAAEAWERFNNMAPPLTLRANTLKIDEPTLTRALAEHAVQTAHCRYAPDGLVVRSGNPLKTPLAAQGLFFIQDEASQLVSLLGDVKAGDIVLDACASPGGKTTAMAAQAADRAWIVAADVRASRVELLKETVAASGSRNVRVVQADLESGLPFGAAFDLVLVDAPCSGLGTLRRDPDIKWRRREADLQRFRDAQLTMVRNAARAVRTGGRLVYATCSSEPEENDEVVAAFLAAAPEFKPVRPTAPPLQPLIDPGGFFRTSPPAHGLEAFFGAVLHKSR
jgi:16S rRNA (cytosine967-C5)-methyltransferase